MEAMNQATHIHKYTPAIENLERFIGNTPMIPLHIHDNERVQMHAKLEWNQLGGSVKSRPAFNIIKEAILTGELSENVKLIDASSGNTAIAYASIAARLGIRVTICLPENASESRKTLLKALGAKIEYSSPFGGTDEAQALAHEIVGNDSESYFYADQYSNENNWKAHYLNTAEEIWQQTQGQITHFVCGIGTSGSITGISRRLKEYNPQIKTIALQPDTAMHIMEGWKHFASCKIPGIYDPFVIDEEIKVGSDETVDWLRKSALSEGLVLSPSSAANLAGAIKLTEQIRDGYVVTLFPDNGDKYMDFIKEWI